MFCPYKMANSQLESHWDAGVGIFIDRDWECEKGACALWNEHFGMCSIAVDAYLKEREDRRREREIIRKGG